jgi:hypothetical protein
MTSVYSDVFGVCVLQDLLVLKPTSVAVVATIGRGFSVSLL